jgi:UPF0755 protein
VRDDHEDRTYTSADEPSGGPAPSLFDGDLEDHLVEQDVPGAVRDEPVRPSRRRRGGLLSCLVVTVVILALVAVGSVLVLAGIDKVRGLLQGPEDYSGRGTGSVVFEVRTGDSAGDIGRGLKDAGVVKSVDAFTDAASEDAKSLGIQVGFYQLRKKMSAQAALDVLVDPANLVQTSVTIPEGLRVEDTTKLLADKTDIPIEQFRKALNHPDSLGLPAYAKGSAEGYLFPATYTLPPDTTASDILSSMVDRWQQAADEADLEADAAKLHYSPAEVMVVASLVEAEANRDEDRGKVARVIYNRLETDATNHLLQIDATVNYALGRDLGLGLTTADLQVDSPYNTRKYPGLPPGPIESPGDKAIEAATHPTEGNWVYYVTVNLDTGKTKFTKSYGHFLAFKRELKQWCAGSDRC